MNQSVDDAEYYYLPRAYNYPVLEIPQGEYLVDDSTYPQLSSRVYNYSVYNKPKDPQRFMPCYNLLDIDSDGVFVVGTSDFAAAISAGNFIGTDDFDVIAKENNEKVKFCIPKCNTVTGLKFFENSLFLTANMDSTLEMISVRAALLQNGQQQHYRISELQTEGIVENIDKLAGNSQFIVGTDTGMLSIYDYGAAEVTCTQEIPYAHEFAVTGVSSHPSSQKVWISSSGYECLLWDKSKESPASSILNHNNQITAVHWTSQDENKELLVLGDECGNILTVDPRSPNKILNTTKIYNRPVTKLSFNGSSLFGAISGNVVKILEATSGSNEMNIVYQEETPQMLYSLCWDTKNKNTLYVVGDQKTAIKISL